jgi:hypothetical protein
MNRMPSACVESSVEAIIDQTIVEIKEQGYLPLSRSSSHHGQTPLCAGALAMRVAVSMLCSQEEAAAFEREAASNGDKATILERASILGLPVELIDMMFRVNDSLAESDRMGGVLAYLQGLRPCH